MTHIYTIRLQKSYTVSTTFYHMCKWRIDLQVLIREFCVYRGIYSNVYQGSILWTSTHIIRAVEQYLL